MTWLEIKKYIETLDENQLNSTALVEVEGEWISVKDIITSTCDNPLLDNLPIIGLAIYRTELFEETKVNPRVDLVGEIKIIKE